MPLLRDRDDRPGLLWGNLSERREGRRDDRGDRRDATEATTAVTAETTGVTGARDRGCSGRQMTRRRLGPFPASAGGARAPACGACALAVAHASGGWGVRNHPGDRPAILCEPWVEGAILRTWLTGRIGLSLRGSSATTSKLRSAA